MILLKEISLHTCQNVLEFAYICFQLHAKEIENSVQ